ncbi:MAG TPA: farnesyl diphosphate synthase [Phycisphaerae bacterium]|nr:farnesyl diphosphate synthase [Phycisphaerae bacterium]
MAVAGQTREIDIRQRLIAFAERFEGVISEMVSPGPEVPVELAEAMRYAVLGGGKRVRAYILTRMCELCGGTAEGAAAAAAALECVHAFSLVHDDLPAMDDDDYRRGRPTCHKAFGEAVAILAGNGLLALAFEMLTSRIATPAVAAAAVQELARGTGWSGMIGGQAMDILSEGRPVSLSLVQRIHRYKTARLLETAGRLGAICAEANGEQTAAAAAFGDWLGRTFQIADDLLDVTGDAAVLGKAVAKDAEAGKQTYPAAVGVEQSRHAAREAAERATEALRVFGPDADDLRQLVVYVVDREK